MTLLRCGQFHSWCIPPRIRDVAARDSPSTTQLCFPTASSSAHSCWQTSCHVTCRCPAAATAETHGECRTESKAVERRHYHFIRRLRFTTTPVTNMEIKRPTRCATGGKSDSKGFEQREPKGLFSHRKEAQYSGSLYTKSRTNRKERFPNAFKNSLS